MVVAFVGPMVGLFAPVGWASALGFVAFLAMLVSYVPILRYYELSPSWALALPLIGFLFLLMTWHSALKSWQGRGASWKGRHYGAG